MSFGNFAENHVQYISIPIFTMFNLLFLTAEAVAALMDLHHSLNEHIHMPLPLRYCSYSCSLIMMQELSTF